MGSSTHVPTREERARRRRRRQGLTFTALFLGVLLAGVGALGNSLGWWVVTAPGRNRPVCPEQTVSRPNQTSVNVYNGTDRRGLAGAVADELRRRKFRVVDVANARDGAQTIAVTVRYGSGDKVLARTVARQFPGRVKLLPDGRARDDHSVDVVIGKRYKAMRERTQAAAAIAAGPTPRGCRISTDSSV
ncbi:hypothetical protein GCM10022223_59270 [Kineosporia mesophila]|uniref:LytR/CpsA/Psr regulator C-terminal domain-containing protein n=1 Tax=Kineosporia mesophila TaxID=566012 RepID=A0ABP7AII2_9ACTN|nr:LytR C-terminal domain-containing protein [Kineosporia mesophila]MCD5350716.1 LytR C-terminal domain-containing protein [Kineosporia mesophila]